MCIRDRTGTVQDDSSSLFTTNKLYCLFYGYAFVGSLYVLLLVRKTILKKKFVKGASEFKIRAKIFAVTLATIVVTVHNIYYRTMELNKDVELKDYNLELDPLTHLWGIAFAIGLNTLLFLGSIIQQKFVSKPA
eukprot:TRINITY_DN3573_c0_g1_i17.p4 TRINITY_DN3573_c0_g1~~TRINITY_DN3573_c0_g1_i17.p4  ORF type:complete len:134 (-),score=10.62 TRINITY_DN3573_c0_g1_i17:1049-1450(-)